MTFTPWNFIANLKYMGVGMLCILIVIGIIILLTVLLEKFSARLGSKDKED